MLLIKKYLICTNCNMREEIKNERFDVPEKCSHCGVDSSSWKKKEEPQAYVYKGDLFCSEIMFEAITNDQNN